MKSAAFYEKVFGWHIERPYPSFEAPGLIGQWVSDRAAAHEAGLLMWINVDRIDDILESVRASGGEVIEPPSPDGPRWLATIRDPAGNVLGIARAWAALSTNVTPSRRSFRMFGIRRFLVLVALVVVTGASWGVGSEYRDPAGFSFVYPAGWTAVNGLPAEVTASALDPQVQSWLKKKLYRPE